MRVLTTDQIRELDAYTIEADGISSLELMERACRAFVDWFYQNFNHTRKVGVVCGTGNNGGDGLGIARLLDDWRYDVKVWIIRGHSTGTSDFHSNLERLPERIERTIVSDEDSELRFAGCDILIDAMFGTGLSRPVTEGVYSNAIEAINNSGVEVISVDTPSGLMPDKPSSGSIVRAKYTVSFQLPKLAFLLPDSAAYVGQWKVVDIGLRKDFIRQAETPYRYVGPRRVRSFLRPRGRHDHKGTFGHALLIAGSFGKMGAAILASQGALRSGLGLLTVHIPSEGYTVMQTAVPEAMAHVDEDAQIFTRPPDPLSFSTLGIGPGLGRDSRTAKALELILESYRRPMVLDADALNILSENKSLLKLLPQESILTPHPKEFERLAGVSKNGFERLEKQRHLASSLNCIVVLKGAFTSIAAPDGQVFFNSTGNPGMATGGSGDVLTGVLTGLLAQNYSPLEAAITGVFLHGLAGDLAKVSMGEEGMIASDIVTHLPQAFRKLHRT